MLAKLGKGIGSSLGGGFGGEVGNRAGKWVNQVTGWGDYQVKNNSLMNSTSFGSGGGTRLKGREFIADLAGSTTFARTTFWGNPGCSRTFPWLSRVARNFEAYIIHGMLVEYAASSGPVATATPACGTVVIASEYSAEAPLFATKIDAESSLFSTTTAPFNSALHPIECNPRENLNTKYLVRNDLTVPRNPEAFDMFNFQIITQGMASAYTVGEIWVTYDVEFFKPRTPPCEAGSIQYIQTNVGVTTAAAPLYTHQSYGAKLAIVMSNTTLVMPYPGLYLFELSYYDGGGTITSSGQVDVGDNFVNSDLIFTYGTNNSGQTGSFTTVSAQRPCKMVLIAPGTGVDNLVTITGPAGMAAGTTNLKITCLQYVAGIDAIPLGPAGNSVTY